MIATLLASHWFPNAAYAAAWGLLLGGVAQLFFMLWAGGRDGITLRITWPRWTPEIKEFFVALGAVTVGAASYLIAPFIDTIIASLLPVGTRTALYYADRINQLPLGVLGIAHRHGAAAGHVGAAGAGRQEGIGRCAEPLGGAVAAAHAAVHRRVHRHSRHDLARDLRSTARSTRMRRRCRPSR